MMIMAAIGMTGSSVLLGALIVAFNGLGLSQVTDVLTRVLLFLPKLLGYKAIM